MKVICKQCGKSVDRGEFEHHAVLCVPPKIKRFIVFHGERSYREGSCGWDSYSGSYDTFKEAKESVAKLFPDHWAQIVDTQVGLLHEDDGKGGWKFPENA